MPDISSIFTLYCGSNCVVGFNSDLRSIPVLNPFLKLDSFLRLSSTRIPFLSV